MYIYQRLTFAHLKSKSVVKIRLIMSEVTERYFNFKSDKRNFKIMKKGCKKLSTKAWP
jgi:hypothetical protein